MTRRGAPWALRRVVVVSSAMVFSLSPPLMAFSDLLSAQWPASVYALCLMSAAARFVARWKMIDDSLGVVLEGFCSSSRAVSLATAGVTAVPYYYFPLIAAKQQGGRDSQWVALCSWLSYFAAGVCFSAAFIHPRRSLGSSSALKAAQYVAAWVADLWLLPASYRFVNEKLSLPQLPGGFVIAGVVMISGVVNRVLLNRYYVMQCCHLQFVAGYRWRKSTLATLVLADSVMTGSAAYMQLAAQVDSLSLKWLRMSQVGQGVLGGVTVMTSVVYFMMMWGPAVRLGQLAVITPAPAVVPVEGSSDEGDVSTAELGGDTGSFVSPT